MSTILIPSEPEVSRLPASPQTTLNVSEFFAHTIQGEGVNAGIPAIFLRLQDCTLNCIYCDTNSVWRYGNPYTIDELLNLLAENDLILPLKMETTHLVLTGGSPLRQQFELEEFIDTFINTFGFCPYIEIENECTLTPSTFMRKNIRCWNNSPKLSASENSMSSRYKPSTLRILSGLENSWFKFVITKEEDWKEVELDFLLPGLIRKDQVILMPEGDTRERLMETREFTIRLAVEKGVRYSDRLHIVAWNKRTGV